MSIAKTILKAIDNEYVSMADEGKSAGSMSEFVDTGSYALNALISGSLFGGVPSNKVTMYAGDPSTGKTFFSLSSVKTFLDADPTNEAIYFESEGAISKEMLEQRGIDTSRLAIVEVVTAEQFRNNAVQAIEAYMKIPEKDRNRIMFVLDSLGMLSTEKESEDAAKGANTRDMTRAQVLKSAFRTLTLKLSRANIPLIVVNHVYNSMDMYSPKVVSGGAGSQYAASTIITLSKSKAVGKDTGGGSSDNNRVGSIITCTASKSRLTIEGSKVKVLLHYRTGLDRYFGLFDMAKEAGLFVKEGHRWRNTLTDELLWAKDIVNPKKAHETFTEEFLNELEPWVNKTFRYGEIESDYNVEEETEEQEQ